MSIFGQAYPWGKVLTSVFIPCHSGKVTVFLAELWSQIVTLSSNIFPVHVYKTHLIQRKIEILKIRKSGLKLLDVLQQGFMTSLESEQAILRAICLTRGGMWRPMMASQTRQCWRLHSPSWLPMKSCHVTQCNKFHVNTGWSIPKNKYYWNSLID